jgi:hypothetical protein
METLHGIPPWYVTGLVDVAGSFTYSRVRDSFSLHFAMKLALREREILEAIRAYFEGSGTIYALGRRQCYYRVTRVAELSRVVAHFDAHPLRGSKAESYRLWREMVIIKASRFGSPPAGELTSLAARLSRARRA